MSLDRLAIGGAKNSSQSPVKDGPMPRRDLSPRGALAFVRHSTASWRGFRILERNVLEGALSLTRDRCGQTLFVAMHGLCSFADRRLDVIELKAVGSPHPFGLIRDLLNAAMSRPDARSAASTLPADLRAYLKTPTDDPDADRSDWPAAVAEFFASLPTRAPLMIVIDHAHHTDVDSLRAIDALARRAAECRILLVVTYRVDAPLNTQLDLTMRTLIEAQLARALVVASPQVDEARLLYEAALGRSMRPEAAATAMAQDDAVLLTHGLTAVEACRRAGHWSEAKTLAERIIEAGEANQAPYVACSATIALGHILTDQGKLEESLQRLEHIQTIVETIKEDDLIAWLYWGLARAYWGKSDRRRAFQMLRLAQTVVAHVPDAALGASIAVCGVEWLADNRRARTAYDWLESIERLADQTDGPAANAAHALANGVIALAEHDEIAAAGYFRAALRRWTELDDAYAIARARMRLASALLEHDSADGRREGREELSEAHALFTQLGATDDVKAVEELGARHGVRPRARRVASNGSTSPGGITPREREVLGLLVRGMTNRQIAATLSITEKTAEGHVSNILAKLGVASRVQAAGYAVANGLLEPTEA